MKIFQENKDKIFPNIFYIFYNKNELKATTKMNIDKDKFSFNCYVFYAYH